MSKIFSVLLLSANTVNLLGIGNDCQWLLRAHLVPKISSSGAEMSALLDFNFFAPALSNE